MDPQSVTRPFYPGISRYNHEKTLKNAITRGIITPGDEDLIREYVTEIQAPRQISDNQVNKVTTILTLWRRFILVPYLEIKVGSVFTAIQSLKTGKSLKGTPFKQNTIHDYLVHLKAFLIWMIENQYIALPLQKIEKISPPPIDFKTTLPDNLLTEDEVKSLISVSRDSRDRAFFATLYESGMRIGEVCRLTWGNVSFDEWGVKVYITPDINKKTEKQRYCRLTTAREYLAGWKSDYHPGEPLPTSLVFITRQGNAFDNALVIKLISRTVSRAGIQKKVHPQIFRKTRITHMIAQNFQETVIKQTMWGNINTPMLRTYANLSERDIDGEFLTRAGIQKRVEESARPLSPRPCPRCHTINGPLTNYCSNCGMPLVEKAMKNLEELKEWLFVQHPEIVMQYLGEKMEKS
jgi:integrase